MYIIWRNRSITQRFLLQPMCTVVLVTTAKLRISLDACWIRFSVLVINAVTKSNLGSKGWLGLYDTITVRHWWKPKQELKQVQRQEPQRKTDYYLSLHWFLGSLSYTSQGPLPRAITIHSKLEPPPSISTISRENVPQTCSQASLMEAVPTAYLVVWL